MDTTNDAAAPADEASGPAAEFLDLVGINTQEDPSKVWAEIESRCGKPGTDKLRRAVKRHGGHPAGNALYSNLFRDVDTSLATVPVIAPMARVWLNHVGGVLADLPAGDVLDLGCGSGLYTCFYAWMRPNDHVVGVDINAAGVASGAALAARLGLTNVEFVKAPIAEIDLDRRFDVVISTMAFIAIDGGTRRQSCPPPSHADLVEYFQTITSSLAQCVARHIAPHGQYLSFERHPMLVDLVGWFGALINAGLNPVVDATTQLTWYAPGWGYEMTSVVLAGVGASQVTVDTIEQSSACQMPVDDDWKY